MAGEQKGVMEQARDAINAATNKVSETWEGTKNRASEVGGVHELSVGSGCEWRL